LPKNWLDPRERVAKKLAQPEGVSCQKENNESDHPPRPLCRTEPTFLSGAGLLN
jgi:hypothetical protein